MAAGIAKENPMRVAIEACKLGVVAFLLPYMFVYNPLLLLQQVTVTKLIFTLIGAAVGCISIAAAAQGFILLKANWIQRLLLLLASLMLFSFDTIFYTLASVCLAVVLIWQCIEKRKCASKACQ